MMRAVWMLFPSLVLACSPAGGGGGGDGKTTNGPATEATDSTDGTDGTNGGQATGGTDGSDAPDSVTGAVPWWIVGKWSNTSAGIGIDWFNISTGQWGDTSANGLTLVIDADGSCWTAELHKVTSFGCTQTIKVHEIGTCTLDETNFKLTVHRTSGKWIGEYTCGGEDKTSELEPGETVWTFSWFPTRRLSLWGPTADLAGPNTWSIELRDMNCVHIAQCSAACGSPDCPQWGTASCGAGCSDSCYQRGTPEGVEAASALITCYNNSGCADQACADEKCATETAACQ